MQVPAPSSRTGREQVQRLRVWLTQSDSRSVLCEFFLLERLLQSSGLVGFLAWTIVFSHLSYISAFNLKGVSSGLQWVVSRQC